MPDARPTVASLTVAAEAGAWREAGFRIEGESAHVGRVRLHFAGKGDGPRISWALRRSASLQLDGLPTERSGEPEAPPAPAHPNGVERLDHIVAFSPDLERTISALKAAGLDFRRLREGPTPAGSHRQAFFRLGELVLEVVEHPPGTPAAEDRDAPSRFYGLAFVVEDLEAAAETLGDRLGEVHDALQPGRQIATVARGTGLGLPVAFMTPRPAS